MKKGEKRTEIKTYGNKEKVNITGVVAPLTGDLLVQTKEYGNSKTFIELLDDVAKRFSSYKKIHLYIDNAGFHKAKVVKKHIEEVLDEKIEIYYLPSYSPKSNPIERMWKKLKYDHKNIMFKTLKKCETAINNYFKELYPKKEIIISLCKI